jgi:hypothetical protein
MSRIKGAARAACLLGALLGGCAEPAPHAFTLVGERPAKAEEDNNTLEKAEDNCKQDTVFRAHEDAGRPKQGL